MLHLHMHMYESKFFRTCASDWNKANTSWSEWRAGDTTYSPFLFSTVIRFHLITQVLVLFVDEFHEKKNKLFPRALYEYNTTWVLIVKLQIENFYNTNKWKSIIIAVCAAQYCGNNETYRDENVIHCCKGRIAF